MRNLKKILALVLALVMSLSLVTMANADYSDAAAIDNDEAVAVMSAIGVLQGSDGKFDPDSILTREQAAKIITYMLMGKEKADKLTTTIAPFADVAADRWSAGSIAYCADQGILDGIGGGKFAPTGKLTGLQFAKMVLCALGYDSAIEGLTGETFAIKAATLAIDLGLDKNVSVDLAAELSRENAAQMAFNALELNTVSYSGGTTVDLPGGTSVTVGATRNDKGTVFMKKYVKDLSKVVDGVDNGVVAPDKFGRPASHEWFLDTDSIYVAPIAATKTYVNSFDKDALDALKDAGYDFTTYTQKYNGGDDATVDTVEELIYNKKAVNGYTVEIYADKKDVTHVIVSEATFAQIGKTTAAKGETAAKVEIAVKGETTATMTISDNAKKTDDLFDAISAGYAKDEYVALYLKPNWNNNLTDASYILGVEGLTAVEGKITKVTVGEKRFMTKVVIDGTAYALNNMAGTVPTAANNNGTLYLDAQGIALGWAGEAAAAVVDYAIVVTDKYTSLEDGKLVTKVTGINSKGETVTVTLDATGSVSDPALWTVYEAKDKDAAGKTDGKYAFTAIDTTNTSADKDSDGKFVDEGKVVYTADTDITATTKKLGNAYFDAAMKVIFVDATGEKVTVKDGFQKMDNKTTYAVMAVKDGNYYVAALYVVGAESDGTVSADDIIYVAKKTGTISVVVDDAAKPFYTYDAYVNGVLVEDFYSEDDVAAGFYKSVKAEKTGAYILAGKGYSESTGKLAVKGGTATAYANGILTVGADYDVASATVVDLSTAAEGLTATCKVTMLVNTETNVASLIYIVD